MQAICTAMQMALVCHEVTFMIEKPAKWQKAMGVKRDGRARTEWKRYLRQRAQAMFPRTPGITLATCDALLIAQYCWEQYEQGNKYLHIQGAQDG